MKIRLRSFALAMAITGVCFIPTLTCAAAVDDAKLNSQISALQDELDALKAQVKGKKTVKRTRKNITTISTPQVSDVSHQTQNPPEYLPFDLDVPGQAFVSTGPYVGVPVQYAGSQLIINSPSVNTDTQLLDIRKSIMHQIQQLMGTSKPPKHSHLLISGIVEGQANYTDIGGQPSTTDIDVTNVTIDFFLLGPSDWILSFIEMTYDNGLPAGSFYRVSNSRLFINKAFVTLGDFNTSPYYLTFGQFYVPFGRYSSLMVSPPLTQLVARTKARSILVGVDQQGDNAFYGALYIFRGDSHAASVSKINNGGINVGYKFRAGSVSGNVGAGAIANIADGAGMQIGTGFQTNEQLVHRVPALNARALMSFGESITWIAEYVGATTRFNPNNMSYNAHGAKPWAVETEAAYSFYAWTKPSSIGLGYNKSGQALAMGIPMTRMYAVFNTSLYRNTLQSLEFRKDRNYASSKVGNGQGGPGATCTSAACTATGKSDYAVTLQFDYYF